ncbi:MAG: hypothetical protein JO245_13930 [Pseudolabrys sp.]|nr:hypothetical protein [Pseudolabrys sp.]
MPMVLRNRNVASTLRRDALFVWHALISVVFISFAGLAVGAAVMDLFAIAHQ